MLSLTEKQELQTLINQATGHSCYLTATRRFRLQELLSKRNNQREEKSEQQTEPTY